MNVTDSCDDLVGGEIVSLTDGCRVAVILEHWSIVIDVFQKYCHLRHKVT